MTDLNTLFARDPLKLTVEELDEMADVIIKNFREQRVTFNAGNKLPSQRAKALPKSLQQAKDLGLNLDLDDL